MYRGSRPRILPIIIVILVVVALIVALVTIGRAIFSGGSSSTTPTTGTSLEDAVLDRGSDRSVRWTVRGPIVADEDFRTYQITISPTARKYVTYSGYLGQVLTTKTYDNNANAYEEFVFALNKANITNVRGGDGSDIRGVCATKGIAYQFETLNDGSADNTLWSSTCAQSKGTLGADPLQIHALFVNQIPAFKPLFTGIY